MKQRLSLVAIMVLVLVLTACGTKSVETAEGANATTAITSTPISLTSSSSPDQLETALQAAGTVEEV